MVFGLFGPSGDLNGDLVIDAAAGTVFTAWDLNEGNFGNTLAAELGNLFAGGLYRNVHTPTYPGGEIRGQINRVPEPATLTLLGLGLAGLGWMRSRRRRDRSRGDLNPRTGR